MEQIVQDEQNSEVPQGFLVIGLSNTFLFSGEAVYEMMFLDLSTGEDFAMPITEEQAAFVASIAGGSLAVEDEEPSVITPDVFKGPEEASQL